jgi:hypothetical protein
MWILLSQFNIRVRSSLDLGIGYVHRISFDLLFKKYTSIAVTHLLYFNELQIEEGA